MDPQEIEKELADFNASNGADHVLMRREVLKLTQTELAEKVAWSQTFISAFELGKKPVPMKLYITYKHMGYTMKLKMFKDRLKRV